MSTSKGEWIGTGVPKSKRKKNEEQNNSYSITNSQWVNPTKANYIQGKDYGIDVSENLRTLMASGASSDAVRSGIYQRGDKIRQNPELEPHLNDDVMQEAWRYVQEKEKYNSDYENDIGSTMNKIQNRKAFSYNPETDPLYQSYKTQALERGATAVDDTLARAAQMGGGMNSYAITAAQQTQNAYNQQINDVIPQLYQLAYEKYLNEGQENYNMLSALLGLDETGYNRYQDTLNRDMSWNEIQYNRGRDSIEDSRYSQEWDYTVEQNKKEEALNLALTMLESGWDKNAVLRLYQEILNGNYSPEDIKKNSDLGDSDIDALVDEDKVKPTGKTETEGKTKEKKETEPEKEDRKWVKGMQDLGLGLVYDPILLTELDDLGAIYETDGHLHWTDGWNAQNYKNKMNATKNYFGL